MGQPSTKERMAKNGRTTLWYLKFQVRTVRMACPNKVQPKAVLMPYESLIVGHRWHGESVTRWSTIGEA